MRHPSPSSVAEYLRAGRIGRDFYVVDELGSSSQGVLVLHEFVLRCLLCGQHAQPLTVGR